MTSSKLESGFKTAVCKIALESVLSPVIGNGTIKSGALKIGAGFVANKALPAAIINALTIDGMEDVISGFLKGGMGGSSIGGTSNGIIAI